MKKSGRDKIREPELTDLEPASFNEAEERMEGLLIQGETLSFSRGGPAINTCRFEECTFSGDIARADIMDAVFDRCDLSNAVFSDSSLIRVKFIKCRMTGCDFSCGTFRDTQWIDSSALLANWNGTSLSNVSFVNTNLREASFTDAKQTSLRLDHCDLSSAELFHVSLADVDLSTCLLDGIVTDPESLRGCEVSFDQAASLIRIFGLKVKV